MQFPGLLVVDLDDGDAEAAQDVEVGAGVAPNVRHGADDEDSTFHAALQQCARDDEAVAAVVAAAAEHGDPALEAFVEGGLDRRDDLAAGILHQDEGRDADLFDGVAIGLAHLRGVEDSHGRSDRYGALGCAKCTTKVRCLRGGLETSFDGAA